MFFVAVVLFIILSSTQGLKGRGLKARSPSMARCTTTLQLWKKPKAAAAPEPTPKKQEETKPKLPNLLQLIAFGAGAPVLGDFEKFDEQGRAIFRLEANNLVDSKGESIQARAKFFNDGWTEESAESLRQAPPNFFANLLSGGRLQSEWDEKNRITK